MTHLDSWHGVWKQSDNPSFHFPLVHEHLLSMSDDFLPVDKQLGIFVPLCGKSIDMVHLYNLGYIVIGLEVSEKAIELFGQENNISLVSEVVEGFGTVYRTEDNRLHLYCGDFFQFGPKLLPSGIEIGAIYDQKSVVAIEPSHRESYFKVMGDFCQNGKCNKYLVTLVRHDWGEYPPHIVPKDYIQQKLGELGMKELKSTTSDRTMPGKEGVLSEDTYLFGK